MSAKRRPSVVVMSLSKSPRQQTMEGCNVIKEKHRREFHEWCKRHPKKPIPSFWQSEAAYDDRVRANLTARSRYEAELDGLGGEVADERERRGGGGPSARWEFNMARRRELEREWEPAVRVTVARADRG